MDVHQLRLLRELSERGSVSAVAEAMFVSPSAVSQQLSALQRSVAAPLTRRSGRTLVLTEAGQALAAAATEVDRALNIARSAVDAYLQDGSCEVSVCGFHSAARVFLPRLAARMTADDSPRVVGDDQDVATERFIQLTGDYDVVIAHRLSGSQPWPRDRVSVTPLMKEPLDVALPADHPLAAQDSLRPEDLAGLDWVAAHDGFPAAGIVDAVRVVTGQPPRIRFHINDLPTAVAIVGSGNAVCMLPRYTCNDLVGDKVVTKPVSGISTARRVDALARPDRMAQRAVASVAGELREIARDLVKEHRGGGHPCE